MSPRCVLAVALLLGSWIAPVGAADVLTDGDYAGARVETFKTIGDVRLQIYIFEPAEDQPAQPAIVFFFGGGWKNGQPKQFVPHCRYLASRGMVAMTAEYRISSRHGTRAKECVQDGKSAVRWVRTNAARLGIDPNRIAAGGGSAGGHVAACTGVLEEWDEPGEATAVSAVPNALVLFNPVLSLSSYPGMSPENEQKLGGLADRMGTEPVNLSPAHHVRPALPPTVAYFGTDDGLLEGAQYFTRRMQAAGNRCELKTYEGQRHGFFNYGRDGNAHFEQTLTDADRFLTSLEYLTGEPNVAEWMKANPGGSRPRGRRE